MWVDNDVSPTGTEYDKGMSTKTSLREAPAPIEGAGASPCKEGDLQHNRVNVYAIRQSSPKDFLTIIVRSLERSGSDGP